MTEKRKRNLTSDRLKKGIPYAHTSLSIKNVNKGYYSVSLKLYTCLTKENTCLAFVLLKNMICNTVLYNIFVCFEI